MKEETRAFFHPPSQLLEAQAWLQKHGLLRSHCNTLCTIHNRWKREPNKPLRLSDIERLHGISRQTAKKILDLLAIECGYTLERVNRRDGGDNGYLMRRRDTACEAKATRSTEPPLPNRPFEPKGMDSANQGASSMNQGGGVCATPSRTNTKNLEIEKELSSPRCRAELHRLEWKEGERMFNAALEVFERRQAQLGGAWELEEDDYRQLLHAAQRLESNFQHGLCSEGLETRLADALDRAEAHAWGQFRPFPHDAATHFGVHLRDEPFEPVRVRSAYRDSSNCSDEMCPAVNWSRERGQWYAMNDDYMGETFDMEGEDSISSSIMLLP